MLDAIERARVERRLALKIAALLFILVMGLHTAAGWIRGRVEPPKPASVAQEQSP